MPGFAPTNGAGLTSATYQLGRTHVRTILRIAMVIAAAVFAVSVGIHVRSLLGWPLPTVEWIAIHAAVLILALPYIWLIRFLQKEQKLTIVPVRRYYMGCPPWMRKAVIGLFVYFLLVMFVFWTKTHGNSGNTEFKQWVPQDDAVFFSSGWMSAYSAFFAIYFSALKTIPWPRRCPNGHRVPAGRGYCEECGALIKPS